MTSHKVEKELIITIIRKKKTRRSKNSDEVHQKMLKKKKNKVARNLDLISIVSRLSFVVDKKKKLFFLPTH